MKRLIIFLVCLTLIVAGGVSFLSLRGARLEKEARAKAPTKPAKLAPRNVQLIPGPLIRPDQGAEPRPQASRVETKTERLANSPGEPTQVATAKSARSATAAQGAKSGLGDPIARLALSEVGFNQAAEEYWLSAINDPNLSDHERRDLIEDLNEEGFEDPKNLTEEDLPLILRRIELIETYAPDAMDDVNAAAFQEAYKDLVNMFAKVAGL